MTDPVGDVVSFIHDFEEKYGRSHPVFYQGTYSQVNRNTKIHLLIQEYFEVVFHFIWLMFYFIDF